MSNTNCDSCNYCKNLKMTEYNYFCYSEDKNKDWFQRPRYRVFNVEVWEEEYRKIIKIYNKLDFDKNESYTTRFQTAFKKMRATLSQEKKQEYFNIPHFNREIFTKITGVEKEDTIEEMTLEQICKELGRNVKIIK